MREIQPHPEIRRSYYELRQEFRAQALENLRNRFNAKHIRGWNAIVERASRQMYTARAWALEMVRRVGECSPITTLDFGLKRCPPALGQKIEGLAEKADLHESVTWASNVEGVIDHDAPWMPDPDTMTDDEICDYVESAIEFSREKKQWP